MRLFLVLTSPVLLVTSCQFNYSGENNRSGSDNLAQQNYHVPLPATLQQHEKELKIARYQVQDYSVKTTLLTHSQFVFLEEADLSENEIAELTLITDQFENVSDATTIFSLDNHPYKEKYTNFKGRTITVYDYYRTKHAYTISKVVLVKDMAMEKPYAAAVVNFPTGVFPDYAWATTNKRLNPYPYTQTEDPETAQTALAYFDSLSEFQLIRKMWEPGSASSGYDNYEVHVFDYSENEKYVFVQAIYWGACGSYEAGYSALYHVTRDNWVQEAEGTILHFFHDLIDLDGDKYPELIFRGLSSTHIYEITDKGFTEKKSIQWSGDGCPC